MRHVLYEGDVHTEEAVTKGHVLPLRAVREKTPDGRYQIVLTDEPEPAKKTK
jgi:hypothetical protein